jgi:hypothetical protein
MYVWMRAFMRVCMHTHMHTHTQKHTESQSQIFSLPLLVWIFSGSSRVIHCLRALRFWLPTKCVVIAAGVITIPGEDNDLMTLETPFPIL